MLLRKLLHSIFHDFRDVDGFQRWVVRRQLPGEHRERVILEVVANSFVLDLALDTGGFEDIRVTNARKLKNLGSLEGAARHHDLTLHIDAVGLRVVREVDADCSVSFKLHRKNRSLAQNVQVGSLSVVGEIASGGIASLALVWA